MPLYEFQCEKCGQHFELLASFAQKEKGLTPRCPNCGAEAVKPVVSVVITRRTGTTDTPVTSGGCCSRG